MPSRKIVPHLLIILTPMIILAALLIKDANPSGVFTIRHQVGDSSPFIDRFLPDTRALSVQSDSLGDFQPIVDEPVYASVHAPGDYERLTVELEFQNSDQPIVEIGLLANDDPPQYLLQPLQNLLLDDSDWERLEQEGTVLLQRAKIYASLEDFLANPPDRQTIATYHFDWEQPFRLLDYRPLNALSAVTTSLRGYHEILTYIKDEPLLLQADFVDSDPQAGEDPRLIVFNEEGQAVGEQSERSSAGSLALVQSDLPEGVYKIILKADDDIIFNRLTTRQRYLTLVGPMDFGEGQVRLWTSGKHLSFYAQQADSARQVRIGEEELLMPEAQVRYDYDVKRPGLVEVQAEQGRFTMTHEGKAAFDPRQFFDPDPVKLGWNTDLDALGVNFIIAQYSSPFEEGARGGWLSASASFDLDGLEDEDGDIKLVLSAPGIKSLQNEIQLRAINLTFQRTPRSISISDLWHRLLELLTS